MMEPTNWKEHLAGVQSPGRKSVFICRVPLGKSFHFSEFLLPYLFVWVLLFCT